MSAAASKSLLQSAGSRSPDSNAFISQVDPGDSQYLPTSTNPSSAGPEHQFVQPSETTKTLLPDPYLDQYSYSSGQQQQQFPDIDENINQAFPSVLDDPQNTFATNPDYTPPDADDHGPTTPSPPLSHPEFLSSTEYCSDNFGTDLSAHTSPGEGSFFREADFGLISDFPADQLEYPESRQLSGSASYPVPKHTEGASHTPQLLSPVLTNTPSPLLGPQTRHTESSISRNGFAMSEGMVPLGNRMTRGDIPAHNHRHTPTLTTSPCSDQNLDVYRLSRDHRPTSPIVKVSSYSRGDSPARTAGILGRSSSKRSRGSHSANHLAPAGDVSSDESGDEGGQNNGPQFTTRSVPPGALRTDDGSWIPNSTNGQGGLNPDSRGDFYVPSIKELEEQRQRDEKNAEVRHWLTVSEANSEIDENEPAPSTLHRRKESAKSRRRAKSAGDPSYGRRSFDDTGIPGPGQLIDEESGEDYDDDDDEIDDDSDEGADLPESPPANIDIHQEIEVSTEKFPSLDLDESDLEPLPRQFIRARPWQDSPSNSHVRDTKNQPDTANAAIMLYDRKANNIETASRAATWGTRRMSESDVNSVVGSDSLFKNLSLVRGRRKSRPEKPERKSSILERASGLLPKRSNSNIKRKLMDSMHQHSSSESIDKPRKQDSIEAPRLPQRKSSFGRSKSPSLNTGGAVLAMTGQIAAIGGSGSVCPPSPASGPSSWAGHFRRRSRSKSEIPKGSKPTGSASLVEQMSTHGVPAAVPSPQHSKPTPTVSPVVGKHTDDDDEDDDDVTDQKGVVMEFPIPTETIIPTLEGFKAHVMQLNPRLPLFLVDRVAQEQLRRHQKLMLNKARHSHAVSQSKCAAGKHCFAQGGEATMLPPRPSARDPDATYAQFQVTGTGTSDGESGAPADGSVTAALFPAGVPLPPVKRLPAEFECSLCFKVKKFQKPSDWTKHVHEDVQPFTCTFPNCAEPKSFKRKADWVRHENERHRQLEWWTCNIPDCTHTCYRKDNFVQHLVREHKKPELKPKAAKSRNSGSSKTKSTQPNGWEKSSGADQDVDQMWKLVEECRHDTTKLPQDEPCRFCGNICNSWKKLTVHLARHMEQIAMPVLNLVMQRDISPESVISPVQQGNGNQQLQQHQHQNSSSPMTASGPTISPINGSSPYSGRSPYESAIGNVPQQPFYGTPTHSEGYDMSNNSPYASQMQTSNGDGLSEFPQAPGNLTTSTLAPTYNLSHYPQSTSSSIAGQNVYSNTSQPRAFSSSPNAATYPPPYNAVSRQQAGVQHPAPVAIPPVSYGLEMSPVAVNSIYDGQQPHIYTSPVDTVPYSFQPTQDGMGQPETMYDTSGMGNPNMQHMGNYMQGSGTGYQNQ
ncbi:hypothetical protein FQN54_003213 [Arachnomyces sp. PD_36]|nr:hypothetical protein FQN54_003213 [Arachnomyces sp. PD_36]